MNLHNKIKQQYEKGIFQQSFKKQSYYSNPSQLGWYKRIKKGILPIWLILLIATFAPLNHSMASRLVWLHYLFLALLVLNTLALTYCYFKINKLKNNVESNS